MTEHDIKRRFKSWLVQARQNSTSVRGFHLRPAEPTVIQFNSILSLISSSVNVMMILPLVTARIDVVFVVGPEKSFTVISDFAHIIETDAIFPILDQNLFQHDGDLFSLRFFLDRLIGFGNLNKQSGETEILQLKETFVVDIGGLLMDCFVIQTMLLLLYTDINNCDIDCVKRD